MPNKRLPMRKIKEVLRLKFVCGLGHREIARSCRIAHSTVRDYIRRAAMDGLTWEVIAKLSEGQVEARLFPENRGFAIVRPLPDCQYVYNQLPRWLPVYPVL
jgi:hypothetical protein